MKRIKSALRLNAYQIISRAVEEGAQHGVMRAFKHTDKPSHDAIAEEVERAVMCALCDVLIFDTEES